MTKPKTIEIAFWAITTLFCLELLFTAYWEWFTPQAAQAFVRLGFEATSFRAELSVGKVLGIAALMIPRIPPRVKEWAYAGFAFNLLSAVIAHAAIHDRNAAFISSLTTIVLGTCSYLLWRRWETLRRSTVTEI